MARGRCGFPGYASAGWPADAPLRERSWCSDGNAGSARDRVYYGLAWEARGYRVVLAEYPGYGGLLAN